MTDNGTYQDHRVTVKSLEIPTPGRESKRPYASGAFCSCGWQGRIYEWAKWGGQIPADELAAARGHIHLKVVMAGNWPYPGTV